MKLDFERTTTRTGDAAGPLPAPAGRPVLSLDVSLYEAYLEGSDLTEEQKREFLEVLWSIIVGFVDLGFGIHPVQQALQDSACEQIDENGGTDAAGLLSLQHQEREKGTQPCGEEDR